MDTLIQPQQQGKTDALLNFKLSTVWKELYEYFIQSSSFFVFSVYLQTHKIKEDLNELLLGSKKHNLILLQGFYITST
jgi:hypothetical protein